MRFIFFVGMVLGCLLMSACGAPTTVTTASGAAPTATVSATATMSPAVTATPTTAPSSGSKPITVGAVNAICASFAQPSDALEQIGDLAVDITGTIALGYDSYLLPDSLPTDAPYATDNGHHSSSPHVNPELGNGYEVKLCNVGKGTVVLQAVGLKIASQAPASSAQKDIASSNCATFFQLPGTITGGGCGGALGPHTAFTGTWPGGVSVGTTIAASQTASLSVADAGPKDAYGNLPITIKPGSVLGMNIGMTNYPAPDATYTFAFGVQVSGAPMAYTGNQTPPALLLNKAITWDGEFCMGKSALIVKMTAGKYYYCPKM